MSSPIRVLMLLMMVAMQARAEAYMAAFDSAQWQVQHSPLACRLTQAVPRFGQAMFETVAGGRQRFVLRSTENPLAGGPTQLTAIAPSWNPEREPVALGSVEIADGTQPLRLEAEPVEQLLASLRAGLVPTFARPLQDDTKKIVSVALSPVDFQPAYRQYNECMGQLWSVSFDDIKNTVIEFPQEQSELSAAALKKIDFVLRYIALDRSVSRFEIQAVSSDGKRRLDNLQLSKRRTQQVSEYLMSRGIDANRIESSYHGERGAKNKRSFVAIRLKRSAAVN